MAKRKRKRLQIHRSRHQVLLRSPVVRLLHLTTSYKEHDYLNAKGKRIPCKAPGCRCRKYEYIPVHGSYDFKCLCKHSYRIHNVKTRKCNKCTKCQGFTSKWSCSCNLKYDQHKTVVETREERAKNGGSFGEVDRMLLGEVEQYNDKNVVEFYGDKQKKRNTPGGHLGMKLKSKHPRGKGKVTLAVDKIKDNYLLDQRYQGPQNFTDLVDYGDKYEAQIDQYNDNLALEGGPPKDICRDSGSLIESVEIGFAEI